MSPFIIIINLKFKFELENHTKRNCFKIVQCISRKVLVYSPRKVLVLLSIIGVSNNKGSSVSEMRTLKEY